MAPRKAEIQDRFVIQLLLVLVSILLSVVGFFAMDSYEKLNVTYEKVIKIEENMKVLQDYHRIGQRAKQ